MSNHIEFHGEQFLIEDKVGLMPLLRFAHASKAGLDSSDMDGLAAMYDLLADCFPAADWERFQRAATAHKSDAEELFGIVKQVIEAMTERPTGRPADSPAGPTPTGESSEGVSSSVAPRLSVASGSSV